MNWIHARIKIILLISGMLTFTMIQAAFAPEATLQATFGESLHGPLAELIVRNWSVLIALVGLMLIHAAFHEATRTLALTVAGVSKLAFITLLLSHGTTYLGGQAAVAVVIDSVMVGLFGMCLVAARQVRPQKLPS